jgi:hypothetical protein
MYDLVAFALWEIKQLLGKNSPSFCLHIRKTKCMRQHHAIKTHGTIVHINHAVKKSTKLVHSHETRYREADGQRIVFSTQSPRIIKHDPSGCCYFDACLDGVWLLTRDEMLLVSGMESGHVSKDKEAHFQQNDKNSISINDLEFSSVIVNFCTALTIIEETNFFDNP